MGMQKQQGFTIIEVSLFLAISGLLVVFLLGGWTTMINNQRYRDSVDTLQAFLQQQYNLVYNVENGRADDLGCDSSGIRDDDASATPRGQTSCVLLGRYIHVSDGNDVTVYPVIGTTEPTMSGWTGTDIDSILAHDPERADGTLGISESNFEIPWSATIVQPGTSDARSFVILIVRAPSSGTVHTYTSGNLPTPDTLPGDFGALVTTNNENTRQIFCVDAGNPLSGGTRGVSLAAYATSQSSVRPLVDGEGGCNA